MAQTAYWNGPAVGGPGTGTVNGGTGTWSVFNANWTDVGGVFNAPAAYPVSAIFLGTPGTVTVDSSSGAITVTGMQFAISGYQVIGDAITLTAPQTTIGVGDGTLAGAGYNAYIDSALTGAGGLQKTDLGTLVLSGANNYAGATIIDQGVLQAIAANTFSQASATTVNTGGTLDLGGFAQSINSVALSGGTLRNGALSGAISSTGGNVSGLLGTASLSASAGTTTLSGANSYTGTTSITGGTLTAGNVNAFSALSATTVGAGGTLDLGGFAQIINTVNLAGGTLTNGTLTGAISSTGGTISNLAGTASLSVSAGTTTVSGSNAYTGPTSVSGGKLSVDGSLSSSAVTVLSGATLGGNGTIGATTIQSGAIIAPGNSIGTLNVIGNLTLAPGSTYEVEIAGNGTSDRIAVTGIATLTGSQVGVTALDPQTSYVNGQRYTILTATGGVAGAAPGAVSHSAFLDLTVDKQASQVDLVIAIKGKGSDPSTAPAIFQTVAQTPNQYATAAGLNSLPQVGGTLALYNSLLTLDAPGARAAFDALSGEIHGSAKTALIEGSWFLHNTMNDRLRSTFGAVGAAPMVTMNYGFTADLAPAVKGPMPRLSTERFAVWGQGFGTWGKSEAQGGIAKLTRSTGGLMIGADVGMFDAMRFGVVAGYSRSEFDVKGRLSSGESDNYHLGLYGGGQWSALGLRTGASYTWHDVSTRRTVAFAGFSDNLRSDYNAGSAQVFGELGYRIDLGQASFEPFAGLTYVNLHTEGFREIGGAAALSARSDDTNVGYSTLGLRASTSFAFSQMDLTIRGALAWRHAFGDVDPAARLAFSGSDGFTVAGLPIAKNAALVEAGLDLAISKSATLGISYTGQLATDAQDHAFKANLAMRF